MEQLILLYLKIAARLVYVNIYICRSETLGKDRCTASTDNGKDRCTVQYSIVIVLV